MAHFFYFVVEQVLLQGTFHGPLAYELEYPLAPIFTRRRAPTTGEVEAGLRAVRERSFYRNTYSMVGARCSF